jgi:predicted phosphodiesterase
MRYLVLSDIHGNDEALAAALAHVRRKRWEKAVVLGDVVGYGANPNQAIEMVRSLKPVVAIRGNHDKVCSGVEDGEMFNRVALHAALWTRRRLTPANQRWLRELPQGPLTVDGAFTIAHGTPIDEDAYIFGEIEALNVFRRTDSPLCFFGHSHFPVVFALSPEAVQTVLTVSPVFRFRLENGVRYLVNPGSVGQPRDGNPRSSFAMYDDDTQTVTIYRVPYRIERTQQRILEAGLPRPLADRLALGR